MMDQETADTADVFDAGIDVALACHVDAELFDAACGVVVRRFGVAARGHAGVMAGMALAVAAERASARRAVTDALLERRTRPGDLVGPHLSRGSTSMLRPRRVSPFAPVGV